MPHWAAPGVKCVCIADAGNGTEAPLEIAGLVPLDRIPKLHDVLTIKGVEVSRGAEGEFIGVVFVELPPLYVTVNGVEEEVGFDIRCFRPVSYPSQSVENDVALFSGALKTRELETVSS